ncbi:hypothetical protein NEF87_004117 [Candidatus Lokiarchaeum ossiferum]|uniref:Zn-dependent PLC domain-containing protein n=1 Tax=Candidatus Lokiarchaeum ossiferum TaxID=2951803 RepID=A0ABY6HY87_9ARCH|nr:hypothetical protein NEF87_004117 [Candidatus Lokiarchaeum sp. B-35]
MKQIRRKTIFNSTFGVVLSILILNIFIGSVSGWKNGSFADDPAVYNYVDDYGTHDWIADYALQSLMALNGSQWQWLEDRKEIYYVGTEAPDNSGINIVLDGSTIEGFGDTTYHHVYFYENGTVLEDDSAVRAKWCGDWADVSFSAGDFDKAAFYLGAMTHYIADLGMYAHVADNYVAPYNIYFDEHHSTIEGYVNTRTNEYDDMVEFFHISNINVTSITPYNSAIQLAWQTYKDPSPSESITRDALWLHNNHFTGWALTYDSRMSETNETKLQYYDRFEENLWNAISKCASSIYNVCGSGDTASTSTTATTTTTTESEPDVIDQILSIFTIIPWWTILILLGIVVIIVVIKRNN